MLFIGLLITSYLIFLSNCPHVNNYAGLVKALIPNRAYGRMYSYDIPVKSSWERRDPGQCRNSLGRADELGTVPHWRRCPVPACCASLGGRHPSETEILPRTPCLRVAEEFLAPVFLWAPFWLPQSMSQSFRDLLFQAGKLPFAGG